jgi:hypothetical protein
MCSGGGCISLFIHKQNEYGSLFTHKKLDTGQGCPISKRHVSETAPKAGYGCGIHPEFGMKDIVI